MQDLEKKGRQIRMLTLETIHSIGNGHVGGSLSIVDVLTCLYFGGLMRVDPQNPQMEGRDRLIVSKGHAGPAVYAALAEKGFFPKEELTTFRAIGSRLQGHPDMNKAPGIDFSAGSLGQGVSAACGMALAGKLGKKDYRVYTILGDGEIEEGQVWEAAMFADHYKLDNLTVILDYNGLQIDGSNDQVMSLGNIRAKAEAFGYDVIEVADGNDMQQVLDALHAPACPGKPDPPSLSG